MNELDETILRSLPWVIALVTALAVGLAVVSWYRRDFQRPGDPSDDVLETLERALDDGGIEPAELRRVRLALARKGLAPPPLPSDDDPPPEQAATNPAPGEITSS